MRQTFRTDAEVEDFLTLETRKLPMPDGTARSITLVRLDWLNADSLIDDSGHTLEALVEGAIETAKFHDVSFTDGFSGSVRWLHARRFEAIADLLD